MTGRFFMGGKLQPAKNFMPVFLFSNKFAP